MSSTEYTLCRTKEAVTRSLKVISAAPHIVLDLEGRDLGAEGGHLSILTVRANDQTFIFDAVVLSGAAMKPLFAVLAADQPAKIMYDGRRDWCELYHAYGVEIGGVLDMQIADITSRSVRRETRQGQLERLIWPLPRGIVMKRSDVFKHVHRLLSLQVCLTEHGITSAKKGRVDHSAWLKRPLSEESLVYAAQDVYLIGELYMKLISSGFIRTKLVAQSARYVRLWKGARPRIDDRFKSHPFLMLDILENDPSASRKICSGCARSLSQRCFSKKRGKV
ncbi:hypothetical protein HGRIS_000252 [Hohenbuehelia grisea]|uniref:3'-5' exonuclease domain-containing protein n=1 Tax=Hohenbuehelia grisea TaxID=104357 RepID=A0ABR3JR33_9AGAR